MFKNLKYKFMQFMYGRYATRGPDALYKGTLIFYLVLFVVNLFIKNKAASRIISALMVLLLVWLIFRMLSKNHVARMKENEVYLKLSAPLRRFFTVNAHRIRDIKTKRYRVCPKCKATVRLPIKKGRHNVRCPKCSNNFKVNILF